MDVEIFGVDEATPLFNDMTWACIWYARGPFTGSHLGSSVTGAATGHHDTGLASLKTTSVNGAQ